METMTLVLGALNTLLLAVILVMLTRARPGTTDAAGLDGFRSELRTSNAELRQDLSAQRSELTRTISDGQARQDIKIAELSASVERVLVQERDGRLDFERSFRAETVKTLEGLKQQLATASTSSAAAQETFRTTLDKQFSQLREQSDTKLERIRQTVDENLQGTLKESLKANADRIEALTEANGKKHLEIQSLLQQELDKLRSSNEIKLEEMRITVDEKLQGTLEKRLGESFALVSQRLEQVQKGLGEMQTLASDVGGLKRVLTNVKSRGTWGEVQLSRQLEDILAPDQYTENAEIKIGSAERVEFAILLPGDASTDVPVYLPIDSKFPQEDYERLLNAQEAGDKAAVDNAGQALERAILQQAKNISSKYINPPVSTDFAIMYLPTESLFAEVVSRSGLASKLQNQFRVMATGPTTLMSLLNSLQMGFRTIAIEQRSSEVWQVLSAAKTEFQKYGKVWEKLAKQLQTAQNTVDEAGRRTRAVERKLRQVETIETIEAAPTAAAVAQIAATASAELDDLSDDELLALDTSDDF